MLARQWKYPVPTQAAFGENPAQLLLCGGGRNALLSGRRELAALRKSSPQFSRADL